MPQSKISPATVRRLPTYHYYLKNLVGTDTMYISAPILAAALGLGEIQVRKDLAAISSAGRPKIGYRVTDLLDALEQFLGYRDTKPAVLVGAGKLSRGLLSYEGFGESGLHVVALFDRNAQEPEQMENGCNILPMSQLESVCKSMDIRVGILTVPANDAQETCDELVRCGVTAVWNFSVARVLAPPEVLVINENLVASVALLVHHLDGEKQA